MRVQGDRQLERRQPMNATLTTSPCAICHHAHAGHYVTFGGQGGCTQEVGHRVPITSPCTGYAETATEEQQQGFYADCGTRAMRMIVAHQDGRRRLADAVLGEG
jgi:hypothetical protein